MLTAEQLRAARAMRRLDQAQLARRAGVSVETIKRLEGGEGALNAQHQTLSNIRKALEFAGIEFVDGDRPGVRLRADPTEAFVEAVAREITSLSRTVIALKLRDDPGLLERDRDELVEMVASSVANILRQHLAGDLPGN